MFEYVQRANITLGFPPPGQRYPWLSHARLMATFSAEIGLLGLGTYSEPLLKREERLAYGPGSSNRHSGASPVSRSVQRPSTTLGLLVGFESIFPQ